MDTLQIYRTPSAVTLHDAQDKICFAIEASLADNMYHLSVRSVTQCRPSIGPYPDFWHEEIAKIVWSCETPFIILRESKFDIDTFMRSDGLFDKFVISTFYGSLPERVILARVFSLVQGMYYSDGKLDHGP